MTETLLAVIAVQMGFILMFAVGIFAIEIYSLYLRQQALAEDAKRFKMLVPADQLADMLGGTMPPKAPAVPADPTKLTHGSGGMYA